MVYIPKSSIKANQFTPGGDWFYVKNNAPYIGSYYLLSNGKAYTGRDQNDPPNEEIFQNIVIASTLNDGPNAQVVEYVEIDINRDLQTYGRLKKTDYNLLRSVPPSQLTFPTPEDYENFIFKRYFLVKTNQNNYQEVSEEVYNEIESQNPVWMWENYLPFTLTWTLKGDIENVFKANRGMIFLEEKKIKRKGLDEYLERNYLQYYLYVEESNLYTDGGLLLNASGEDYKGFYHIHKTQGPMVGSTHTGTAHNKLFYTKFYRGEKVDSLNQTNVIVTEETQNLEYRSALSPSNGGGSSSGGGY